MLDIYWETTSEGLIVDLNADVVSSGGQATGFANLTWDFTEGTLENGAVTTSYFEPINSEGATYTTRTDVTINSQINGNGETVELFGIEEGIGSFVGKYLIRFLGNNALYTNRSLTFTNTSRDIDVYRLVMKVVTSTGDESLIPIGGVIGGEGALRNLVPSYTQIPNFRAAVSDTVVLPALGGTGKWADANPLNGSADPTLNRSGLQYSIVNSPDIPNNWTINQETGEITQLANTNDLKTYSVTIRLTDASGLSSPNGDGGQYNQLFVDRTTDISIDYAKVNPEALSDLCIIDPQLGNSDIIRATNSNTVLYNGVSGIWYLRESTSEINPPTDADGNSFFSLNEPVNEFTISFGSHKSGALSFTSNVKSPGDILGSSRGFEAGETTFFYRKVGDTGWIELPRSLEYNQAGTNFPPASTSAVKRDWPGGTAGLIVSGQGTESNWLSNIRAFDYLSFGANGIGIEYAIVISNLKKQSGNVPYLDSGGWIVADDLHYPICIPWQGLNAKPLNEGDSYEYYRSEGTNELAVDLPVDVTLKIYAETPYGEQVKKFYTDSGRTAIYKPAEDLRFINFQLNGNNYSETGEKWSTQGDPTTPPSGIDLKWSAGFDSTSGNKLANPNANAGVKAVQTSPLLPDSGILQAYATSRIKITT